MEDTIAYREVTTTEADPVILKFPTDLPTDDGEPLESPWHRMAINVLVESLEYHWRSRSDYFCGGNMFVYFSARQIRNKDYRGPDFFLVKNVNKEPLRGSWIVWEEDGRYPDLIVELLSPTTARIDKTIKKDLYQDVFKTAEYFCYDPDKLALIGWRLSDEAKYRPIPPDKHGRLWSDVLQMWLDRWEGLAYGRWDHWLRFFEPSGDMALLWQEAEKSEALNERKRADAERNRADAETTTRQAAENEVERLKAELMKLQAK